MAEHSHVWYTLPPGADVALLVSVCRDVLARGRFGAAFVETQVRAITRLGEHGRASGATSPTYRIGYQVLDDNRRLWEVMVCDPPAAAATQSHLSGVLPAVTLPEELEPIRALVGELEVEYVEGVGRVIRTRSIESAPATEGADSPQT